jgi:hypothetical protein
MYTPHSFFFFNGCGRAAELRIDFFTGELRIVNTDVPILAYPTLVTLIIAAADADSAVLAVQLIDEAATIEFFPTLVSEGDGSVVVHFNLERRVSHRGRELAFKAKVFLDPAEITAGSIIQLAMTVLWSDGSERRMELHQTVEFDSSMYIEC